MTTERVGASAGCFLLLERITKAGYLTHKSKTEMKEKEENPGGCEDCDTKNNSENHGFARILVFLKKKIII